MLTKLSDWQHALVAIAVIAAVTVLSMNGKCNSFDTLTVILAAAGISGSGILASKALGSSAGGTASSVAAVDGGDPTVSPGA
ncbi:MAG: hypothetical protein ACRDUW_10915 [Pseudonocardiaceae bacterium]